MHNLVAHHVKRLIYYHVCLEGRFEEKAALPLDHDLYTKIQILYKGEPRFRDTLPGPSFLVEEDDDV